MAAVESLFLPLPPDAQQVALMREALSKGALVASEGTDRFALLMPLVDAGLVLRFHWTKALYSFEVSAAGRAYLDEGQTWRMLGSWMVGEGPCPI